MWVGRWKRDTSVCLFYFVFVFPWVFLSFSCFTCVFLGSLLCYSQCDLSLSKELYLTVCPSITSTSIFIYLSTLSLPFSLSLCLYLCLFLFLLISLLSTHPSPFDISFPCGYFACFSLILYARLARREIPKSHEGTERNGNMRTKISLDCERQTRRCPFKIYIKASMLSDSSWNWFTRCFRSLWVRQIQAQCHSLSVIFLFSVFWIPKQA